MISEREKEEKVHEWKKSWSGKCCGFAVESISSMVESDWKVEVQYSIWQGSSISSLKKSFCCQCQTNMVLGGTGTMGL